jgi:hypothetical protein
VKLPLTLIHLALAALAAACSGTHSSAGPGAQTPPLASGLHKVNHIIIVMMENHSLTTTSELLPMLPEARTTLPQGPVRNRIMVVSTAWLAL